MESEYHPGLALAPDARRRDGIVEGRAEVRYGWVPTSFACRRRSEGIADTIESFEKESGWTRERLRGGAPS